MNNQNYQFFMNANLEKYIGKWIAICNNKIVSSGKNFKEVFKKAKQTNPKQIPLITKVPEEKTMIF